MTSVYPSRDLKLSRYASIDDYNTHKLVIRVPNTKNSAAATDVKPYNNNNNNNNNNISSQSSTDNIPNNNKPSRRNKPFYFTEKPEKILIQSSGPRKIELPYKSRLSSKHKSNTSSDENIVSKPVPSHPQALKLFTHKSPIMHEFFSHSIGKFTSENGMLNAQRYYSSGNRPDGSKMKYAGVASRTTMSGYRYTA